MTLKHYLEKDIVRDSWRYKKLKAGEVIARKEELRISIASLFFKSSGELADKVYEFYTLAVSEDENYTISDCADELSISPASVSRLLAWSFTPQWMREQVKNNQLSFFMATTLVCRLPPSQLQEAVHFILGEGLTSTQMLLYVKKKYEMKKRAQQLLSRWSSLEKHIDAVFKGIPSLQHAPLKVRRPLLRKLNRLRACIAKMPRERGKKVRG